MTSVCRDSLHSSLHCTAVLGGFYWERVHWSRHEEGEWFLGPREPEGYVSSYFLESNPRTKKTSTWLTKDLEEAPKQKPYALILEDPCQCMNQVAKSVEKTGRKRPDSINLRLRS